MDMKRIYSGMGDNISKEIFLKRLDYSISGDSKYISSLLDITVRKNVSWEYLRNKILKLEGKSVVMFGGGIWGDTILTEFTGFPWKCIIDNLPMVKMKAGIPIVRASDFFADYRDEIIVVSSYKNRDSMILQCVEAGVPMENIIDAGSVMYELTEGLIYFDIGIPLELKNGVFIDGGCFDGSDSKRYIDQFHGNVVCFEPDGKNVARIMKKLKGYEPNYTIIHKALWSGEKTLSFSASDYSSHVSETPSGNMVAASSIDIETVNKTVAMIKMDIEGAELEALQGAENIIKRDHPILAISVYHKPEDILAIPEYILSVFEGYKLYLRHYSFSWYDTVLYAIPEELS